jgi:hypothetical protein
MAANVMSLNYVRPGFAVLAPQTTETPVVEKAKAKTEPKTVRGWVAEMTNAADHARMENVNLAVQEALEKAYLYTLMAQNMVLKAKVN